MERCWAVFGAWVLACAAADPLPAQDPLPEEGSRFGLRFYGTGVDQQDRVRIRIDDDAPGPDASTPMDVGRGSFTIEFWMRGELAENDTPSAGGDRQFDDFRWIDGNIIIDRDIWGGSPRDFGVSIAGGFLRFGVGSGSSDASATTIEGNTNVLDGAWHHVAAVRDVDTGVLSIVVDGVVDYSSRPGSSFSDLSYPDDGVPSQLTPWGHWFFIAAEKHDAGPAFPSFSGYFDELRVWSVALTAEALGEMAPQVIDPASSGLVGYYRFEEGRGAEVLDSSTAGSPSGELIAGVSGNGEWVGYDADPLNVAPVQPAGPPVGEAPEPQIDLPLDGRIYAAGETISFRGSAMDAEDGPLPATQLRWQLLLEVDGTSVVVDETAGIEAGAFRIPISGRLARDASPERFRHLIQLTVTDSDGRQGRALRPLIPRIGELTLETIPAGTSLTVNGLELATPFTGGSIAGSQLEIAAPEALLSEGRAYAFHCWSNGESREHTLSIPELGLSLGAFFAALEGGGVLESVVAADARNADYHPSFGLALSNNYDAFGLCAGRDGTGPYEAALAFSLGVPQGATILDARLAVTATNDQQGALSAVLRTYAVDDVAPFVPAPAPALTELYDLSAASVDWPLPTFVSGEEYASPNLAVLLQAVVDRDGWTPGNSLAIVLDPAATAAGNWRCLRNFASGDVARLEVTYRVDSEEEPECPWATGGGLWRRCDFNCDGAHDVSDVIAQLSFLFTRGDPSCCAFSGDCNGDGVPDVSDPVFLIFYLFAEGRLPPPPFSDCGVPVGDDRCAEYDACDAAGS